MSDTKILKLSISDYVEIECVILRVLKDNSDMIERKILSKEYLINLRRENKKLNDILNKCFGVTKRFGVE